MTVFIRKTCKQCGVEKVGCRQFYRHPTYKDGRMNICKDCHRANVQENYLLKQDYYRPRHAARAATPKYREQRAAYAKTERGREVHRAAHRRYYRLKKLFEARA